jgi:hypothetical protein
MRRKYASLLKEVKWFINVVGIPAVHWWGTEGDYNVLVMDLLGESVEQLFVNSNKKFSLKTVIMLVDQMVL